MEGLCSLEDAFPNIDSGTVHKKGQGPYVGGLDDSATRAERKAARKKAKRCKGPVAKALAASEDGIITMPDPDRPSVVRMGGVESLDSQKEEFALPKLPSSTCLFSDAGYPSYFGKGGEDDDSFANYSAMPGDDSNYRLEPDFIGSFDRSGVDKALGAALPDPSLSDRWKPMTESGATTSFYDKLPSVIAAKPGWASVPRIVPGQDEAEDKVRVPPELINDQKGARAAAELKPDQVIMTKAEKDGLVRRIDELVGRLENLEKRRNQNSQTELLMFVGTGIFLLAAFELMGRRRR